MTRPRHAVVPARTPTITRLGSYAGTAILTAGIVCGLTALALAALGGAR